MRIRLIVRGRIGRSAEAELVDRYVKRIPWPVEIVERPDTGGPPLPPGDGQSRTVLLDERGKQRKAQPARADAVAPSDATGKA